MLMMLGGFMFERTTFAPQQTSRTTEWQHPTSNRIGLEPLSQFTGKGSDKQTLSGKLYPQLTGGPVAIDILRGMADAGGAYLLVSGTGHILGAWVITGMSETRREFFADGTAKVIEFSIDLQHAPDDAIDQLTNLTIGAGISAVLNGMGA